MRVSTIEAPEDRRRWDAFVADGHPASMKQCFWWADPLAAYGVSTRVVACWEEDVLVGGALVRSIPVPMTRGTVTECLEGPVFRAWRPEWADQFLAGVAAEARAARSISVSFKGCPEDDVAEALAAGMQRSGFKLRRLPGDREAVLALDGRTLDDIVAGFSKGTRRAIRSGRQSGVVVRPVSRVDDLREAHRAWLATAARKGFSSVRPWETAEPMLRGAIDAGLGAVFAAYAEGRIVASIFVTFMGPEASYIYGGYTDGAERYRPNHLLHLEAIKAAVEGGQREYNLGTLTRFPGARIDGLDQFKLGFGAVPVWRGDTLVWKRRPAMYGAMERVRHARVGPTLHRVVRRRLVRRAATAEG